MAEGEGVGRWQVFGVRVSFVLCCAGFGCTVWSMSSVCTNLLVVSLSLHYYYIYIIVCMYSVPYVWRAWYGMVSCMLYVLLAVCTEHFEEGRAGV